MINWNSLDYRVARTLSCWRSPTSSAETQVISALKQGAVGASSARPAPPEGLPGAHSHCLKGFASESLAMNTALPRHIISSLRTACEPDWADTVTMQLPMGRALL